MNIEAISFNDDLSKILEFASQTPFASFYKNYLSKKWFTCKSDIAALVLLEETNIIGSTLLILHDEGNLIIGNISCTYISERYRGQSLSSTLINEAKKYCDVLTNLTPVDSIIKQINSNKINGFRPINNYQVWFNCKNLTKRFIKEFSIENITDGDTLLKDNIQNNISFYRVSNTDSSIIGIYSFIRKGIKVSEVCYVENTIFFFNNLESIIKLISLSNGCKIMFADNTFFGKSNIAKKVKNNKKNNFQYFMKLLILLFKKRIFVANRKYFWLRNSIDWSVNYLSTEFCFYE